MEKTSFIDSRQRGREKRDEEGGEKKGLSSGETKADSSLLLWDATHRFCDVEKGMVERFPQ